MASDDRNAYIIDDDDDARDAVSALIESVGITTAQFGGAEEFLKFITAEHRGCVITDLRMPGLSGLDLQERLVDRSIKLPVIVLTGYGDVSTAVRAMKGGAVDFVEKPFRPQELLDRVQQALALEAERYSADNAAVSVRDRMALLTKREHEVMNLVVQGNANKVIALELDISERTVEVHRGRVMKKMQARSIAELITMLQRVTPPD